MIPERWKAFLGIDDDTEAIVRDFSVLVEPRLDDILDGFYARLAVSEAATVLTNSDMMERARKAQKNHWVSHVLTGKFNAEYIVAARAIGQSHYRVGVDLMYYIESYSVVLNEFVALIIRSYNERPEHMRRVLNVVNRVVFLDMALGISAYHESVLGHMEEMSGIM